jgi:hypothetical protein
MRWKRGFTEGKINNMGERRRGKKRGNETNIRSTWKRKGKRRDGRK